MYVTELYNSIIINSLIIGSTIILINGSVSLLEGRKINPINIILSCCCFLLWDRYIGMGICLCYAILGAILFIRHKGISAWKSLQNVRYDKFIIWRSYWSIIPNLTLIFVSFSTIICLVGSYSNFDSYLYNYRIMTCMSFLLLYSIFLLCRNIFSWVIVAGIVILSSLLFEIAYGYDYHTPMILIIIPYLLLCLSMLIKKDGKTAWSAMK